MRLAWDDFRSFAHGWYFNFAAQRQGSLQVPSGWQAVCEFSTKIKQRPSLGQGNQDRIHNMRLCCELISGVMLGPGEIFSLRRIAGDATIERGFKGGPMLVESRLVDAVGGGLCQISSTLFNVALTAGLEILERHNHSVDLWGDERFIELGRDATYVYGLKDLKFRNPFRDSLIVTIEVLDEQEVRARLLSPVPLEVQSRLVTQVLKEIAATPAVSGGRSKEISGWEVLTRRVTRKDERERVTYEAKDIYKPLSIPEPARQS